MVFTATLQLRNVYARMWIHQHMRVAFLKPVVWNSKLDIKARLQECIRIDVHQRSPREIARLASLDSLRAVHAPWKLAVWPSVPLLKRSTNDSWNRWVARLCLPKHVARHGRSSMHAIFQRYQPPVVPTEWGKAEQRTRHAVCSGAALIPDD